MFCPETQNMAHSVKKFRNARFEAKIFRKTTVKGPKQNYVSLLNGLKTNFKVQIDLALIYLG